MISSSKVERKGGLIIYQLNDVDDLTDEPSSAQDMKDHADQYTNIDNHEGSMNRLDDLFEEMAEETPVTMSKKKLTIILDGANIGWGFGNDHFSVNGIILAQQYFESKLQRDDRELSIVTFIPSHYLRRKPHYSHKQHGQTNMLMETDELEKLTDMMMRGRINLVPSGDNDDIYILSYARENQGFIVSNDLYADHIRSISNWQTRQSMRLWLQEYRCGYAFVGPAVGREFMLNPSNALAIAISNSPSQSTISEQLLNPYHSIFQISSSSTSITHLELQPHLQTSLPSIHILSTTIRILAEQQLYDELKHVLLARAYALLRHNFLPDCRRDLQFILTQIDANCGEAIKILESVSWPA